METMSSAMARRVALAAQGFADARPTGRIDRRHLRKALDHMGLIQIDSVNVLVRSQELPLFARLGPHPRDLIHRATEDGELFEYWVHEASHVPTEHHHLHRWKMASGHRWKSVDEVSRRRPGFVDEVLERVRSGGPVVAGELTERTGPKGPWWDWDDSKMVLEWLFWSGELTARRRPNDFARVYDLPERVLPSHVLTRSAVPEREARKELLVLAAGHHGVGTVADLADYHRQKPTVCKPLIAELVEEGRLVPIRVEGWKDLGYAVPAIRRPRAVRARALLSPFDPVVWNRDRALRLFDFHYRIEIYTPAAKRQYGYYVLPFLLGDRIVGRVDMKADRQAGVLRALGAFAEPAVAAEGPAALAEVAAELAAELRLMADWLGLEHVAAGEAGDLVAPLRRALAAH